MANDDEGNSNSAVVSMFSQSDRPANFGKCVGKFATDNRLYLHCKANETADVVSQTDYRFEAPVPSVLSRAIWLAKKVKVLTQFTPKFSR
jgi:hypothetical protein